MNKDELKKMYEQRVERLLEFEEWLEELGDEEGLEEVKAIIGMYNRDIANLNKED